MHEDQQARLEASSPGYRRTYRTRDWAAELLATGRFGPAHEQELHWSRELEWPLYERWLRSKSYVQAVPDLEGLVAAERASLSQAFPDGRIVEPFVVRLVVVRLASAHAA